MYCRLAKNQPEELKQYVAFSLLQMPGGAGTQEIGRMLFREYGALITEVCRLFRCNNSKEVDREVREVYRLPKGSKTSKGGKSDDNELSGLSMAEPVLSSRLEMPSLWMAAQLIPSCVSKEVHTDPWNGKVICDCMNRTPRDTPGGGKIRQC